MGAALMPEAIHPDLWKGNQLARAASRVVPCGDEGLAAELPGCGWPRGALTDLLVQQTGCGELRLLRPAFERLGSKPVVLLQPPHNVQPTAFAWWGLDPSNLMMVKAPKTADALWGCRADSARRHLWRVRVLAAACAARGGAAAASGRTNVRVAVFHGATAGDDT